MKTTLKNIVTQQQRRAKMTDFQQPARRNQSFHESIWSTFTPLAMKHNAVNLGQGFPGWNVEPFILKNLQKYAADPQAHQYAKASGDPKLVTAIADMYNRLNLFGNRRIDPTSEIVVTNGASDGLFVCLSSFVNEGEEVIIIEPFYDAYPNATQMAGGVPVFVPLRPSPNCKTANDWILDREELESRISPKTRAILLNTPHNPTGKIFNHQELQMIADVAIKHNLLVFSDEVYEFLCFDKFQPHKRIANIPGMWERTISIYSASKTFSVTGWKCGWLIGPRELIYTAYLVNQYKVFCVAKPIQLAVADTIEQSLENNYIDQLRNTLKSRCDLLVNLLQKYGFKPLIASSGYFVLVDISDIDFPYDPKSGVPRDYQFCLWLPGAIGIAAIPPSSFYSEHNKKLGEGYARFCFCKDEQTILSAEEGFKRLSQYLKKK
jgi:aspartate/methionine/tyrosine aminotransferase